MSSKKIYHGWFSKTQKDRFKSLMYINDMGENVEVSEVSLATKENLNNPKSPNLFSDTEYRGIVVKCVENYKNLVDDTALNEINDINKVNIKFKSFDM